MFGSCIWSVPWVSCSRYASFRNLKHQLGHLVEAVLAVPLEHVAITLFAVACAARPYRVIRRFRKVADAPIDAAATCRDDVINGQLSGRAAVGACLTLFPFLFAVTNRRRPFHLAGFQLFPARGNKAIILVKASRRGRSAWHTPSKSALRQFGRTWAARDLLPYQPPEAQSTSHRRAHSRARWQVLYLLPMDRKSHDQHHAASSSKSQMLFRGSKTS